MRDRKSREQFESRIQTCGSPGRKLVLEAVGRGEEWKDTLVLTALPWWCGNLKTFLPTTFSQQTSHGRRGLKRTASPVVPAQGHPSGHLIWAPGARYQRKSANLARLGSATKDREEICDRAARVAARDLSNQGSDTTALHSRSPVAVLGRGSHPVQKKRTLTTSLSSQAPLVTTSDLKQKHLTSFLNPRKKRSGLPEVGHQEMADWRWGWSTCCRAPV